MESILLGNAQNWLGIKAEDVHKVGYSGFSLIFLAYSGTKIAQFQKIVSLLNFISNPPVNVDSHSIAVTIRNSIERRRVATEAQAEVSTPN